MKIAGPVCGLLLLSACATTASLESRVEDRAMARWDALLSGDLAGAYEYLSPGIRSSISSLEYQRSVLLNPIQWTSVKYINHECKETTCKVMIKLAFKVSGVLPGVPSMEEEMDISESWILTAGEWYFVP